MTGKTVYGILYTVICHSFTFDISMMILSSSPKPKVKLSSKVELDLISVNPASHPPMTVFLASKLIPIVAKQQT